MLALWEYFWTWSGAPPVTPTPDPTTPGRGSGKGKDEDYQLMPDEFWEARAASLATKNPLADKETAEEKKQRLFLDMQKLAFEQQQLLDFEQERISLLQQLKQASDIDSMKQFALQLKQLEETIMQLEKVHNSRIARASSLRFQILN